MARVQGEHKQKAKAKIGLSTVLLIMILTAGFAWTVSDLQAQVEAAESQYTALELQMEAQRSVNEHLTSAIEEGGTQEQMEQIAREELGLVAPGEKVFYDISR
ncbi:septum formation initiator family protein [Bengtsoniella intestinalis]|uniref:septum formation initiator family protein n=1 Tax=Bengtsoniella intestinalis TaxID=3073143 RepID=UPI00391F4A10